MRKKQINNAFYQNLGNQWLSSYGALALLRQENIARNAWVLKKLKENHNPQFTKILDVGCGAGFLANTLAQNGFQVTGLDLYEESLKVAKEQDRTKTVIYKQGNAYNMPFEDESFDIICLMDFIEHVEDFPSFLKEAHRVIKKTGQIYFHTFNRNLFSWFFAIKCLEWFLKDAPKNIHVYHLFIKPKELLAEFAQINFKPKELTGLKPILNFKNIFDFVWRGEVREEFRFETTSSFRMGYLGIVERKES